MMDGEQDGHSEMTVEELLSSDALSLRPELRWESVEELIKGIKKLVVSNKELLQAITLLAEEGDNEGN